MTEVQWEDPPPTRGPGRPWAGQALADELRAHPGRWALAGSYKHLGSRQQFWKKRGYEAVTRSNKETGETALYVRWPVVSYLPRPEEDQ